MHSRNVTLFDTDCTHLSQQEIRQDRADRVPMPGVTDGCTELSADLSGSMTECPDIREPDKEWYKGVSIEQCDLLDLYKRSEESPAQEYYEGTPGKGEWLTHADPQLELPPRNRKPLDRFEPVGGRRPRGRYAFLRNIVQVKEADSENCAVMIDTEVTSFVGEYRHVGHEAIYLACLYLAMVAHKDMSWKEVLQSDDRELATRALKAEKDSLLSTILVPLNNTDSEYEEAVRLAISGRYLLDLKRVGVWKVRGVKQGFKEDKMLADGPGFVYYLYTMNM